MSSRNGKPIKRLVRGDTNQGRGKQDYHPVELNSNEKLSQRLNHLHENPVRSGMVWEAWQYKYSSAIDYYKNERGLLPVEHF